MNTPEESSEVAKLFKTKSAWTATEEGWRRERFNDFVVELVEHMPKVYQPILNRNELTGNYAPSRKCETFEEAAKYAWLCFGSQLMAPRDDGPPAKVDFI